MRRCVIESYLHNHNVQYESIGNTGILVLKIVQYPCKRDPGIAIPSPEAEVAQYVETVMNSI